MKLGKNQTRWIEALRSGEYDKGKSMLQSAYGSYCCLGVACAIFKDDLGLEIEITEEDEMVAYNEQLSEAPQVLVEHLGLHNGCGAAGVNRLDSMIALNDQVYKDDTNFNAVADHIEKHAEAYFTESL